MNKQSLELSRRAGAGFLALALAVALAGCGGGGGSPGATVGTGSGGTGGTGGTNNPATPTVSVSFTNASGQASNSLTGAGQLTAKASVRDQAGKPVPNALVTFAADATLAVFSPAAGTALTDANGVASITMRAASLASGGAGTVTATSNVAGSTVIGQANYSIGTTTLAFGTFAASPASIQAYGSTVLSVDLLAGSAKYTDQQVNVSFSSACVAAGKATLAAVVATNNGTVQTVYRDQGCGNNDTITVSAAGVARPATVQLNIAPPAAASVQFLQAVPNNKSIVIKGQGGNGRTETATLKFKVVDIFNNPLPGKLVNFTASASSITVNKLSDTTDMNGEVITTVNSGAVATSFRVQATLPNSGAGGADISTWSDTMVVTTGLPVQRAFSLSAEKYNLDSTIESSPSNPATTIQAMIGDGFGNPVPDGTPVVFQTNMGSVGSSDMGGCISTNGGCTVDFRMQNPRIATPNLPLTPCNAATPDNTRPGVATVCASTTDGTNTVFAKIQLFFSFNTPGKVYLDGSSTPLPGGVTDLGTVRSDEAKVFALQINDANNNPMPAGTKVALINPVNANVGTALPDTVPNISPGSAGGPQGSSHAFSIASTQAAGCTTAKTATFNVVVSTPAPVGGTGTTGGVSTYIPFKLTFSCP